MSDHSFDSLTRRASLALLGAAGLAALTGQNPAEAGKRKRRKRKKRQEVCQDRCIQQVAQCEIAIAETCKLGQAACERQVACCATLETCDFASFLSCAFEA